VFIEARDTEWFDTGGLPPHPFVLPRDDDLRVVDAIALAQGPLVNGALNLNNLSGATQATGLGFPEPTSQRGASPWFSTAVPPSPAPRRGASASSWSGWKIG
jgi:hypothetical protein